MKKKKIQAPIILSQYPRYRILPWEYDDTIKYAKESVEYFENKRKKNDLRDEGDRLDHAHYGGIGEYMFRYSCKPEYEKWIKEWTMEQKKYGCYYDFLLEDNKEKKFTIDVKTSIKSEYIKTPKECNLIWTFKPRAILRADYIVQTFYDPDTNEVYFVCAITKELLSQYEDETRKWKYTDNDFGIIAQKDCDMTQGFLEYFSDESRTI